MGGKKDPSFIHKAAKWSLNLRLLFLFIKGPLKFKAKLVGFSCEFIHSFPSFSPLSSRIGK